MSNFSSFPPNTSNSEKYASLRYPSILNKGYNSESDMVLFQWRVKLLPTQSFNSKICKISCLLETIVCDKGIVMSSTKIVGYVPPQGSSELTKVVRLRVNIFNSAQDPFQFDPIILKNLIRSLNRQNRVLIELRLKSGNTEYKFKSN